MGCLVHRRAKPAPCVQHACYDNWEDVPPLGLQWREEHRVERLNDEVYGAAWAWLPVPLWLALVDPDADGSELERLARVWGARRGADAARGNYAHRAGVKSRTLPVLRA